MILALLVLLDPLSASPGQAFAEHPDGRCPPRRGWRATNAEPLASLRCACRSRGCGLTLSISSGTSRPSYFLPLFDAWNCPVTTSCRGSDISVYPHVPGEEPYASVLPEVLRRASAVHCVSESQKGRRSGSGSIPPRRGWSDRPSTRNEFKPGRPGRRESRAGRRRRPAGDHASENCDGRRGTSTRWRRSGCLGSGIYPWSWRSSAPCPPNGATGWTSGRASFTRWPTSGLTVMFASSARPRRRRSAGACRQAT